MPRLLSFLLTLALLPLLALTASATLAADARVRQLNAGNATLCGYGGTGTTFAEGSCSGSSYAG